MYAPDIPSSAKQTSVYRFCVVSLILTVVIGMVDVSEQVKARQTVGQSAASYEKAVAPDSIVAAFGTNLTNVTQSANTLPLPTTLGNLTVEVNGRLASLFFVSPGQINYLLTADPVEGTKRLLVKRCA
jgi:hypothetical protein